MECPNCARRINCCVFPKSRRRVDIHCVCGYNWKGFTTVDNKNKMIPMSHDFYGDWADEEVRRVIRAIRNYCDDDLRFYKGKKLVTTWQEGGKLNRVLVFKNIDEMVKEI